MKLLSSFLNINIQSFGLFISRDLLIDDFFHIDFSFGFFLSYKKKNYDSKQLNPS